MTIFATLPRRLFKGDVFFLPLFLLALLFTAPFANGEEGASPTPSASAVPVEPVEPAPGSGGGSGLPLYKHAYDNPKIETYRTLVCFKGFLTKPEEKILASFGPYEKKGAVKTYQANLSKMEQVPPWAVTVWKKANPPALPSVHFLFPESSEFAGEIWQGPLNKSSVDKIASSPIRKDIVKHIKEDKAAAVWIFVRGGVDVKRDDDLLESIKKQLEKDSSERKAALRKDQAADLPPSEKSLFPLIALDKSDPEEQPLLQQLLKLSPKALYSDSPLALPVFGKGRILGALVGVEINDKNIKDYNYLLTSSFKEGDPLPPGHELFIPDFLEDPSKQGKDSRQKNSGPSAAPPPQNTITKIFKTFDNENRGRQFSVLLLSLFLAVVMLVFVIYADRMQKKR